MKREGPYIRFGAHTKVQRCVLLSPEVDAWVQQEAKLARCSFSEMVNRIASEQRDLRRRQAEPGPGRHADALSRSVDGLADELHKTRGALDFLKAMIDRSTHELLTAAVPAGEVSQRYERWIAGVKQLMNGQGKKPRPKGDGV